MNYRPIYYHHFSISNFFKKKTALPKTNCAAHFLTEYHINFSPSPPPTWMNCVSRIFQLL